MFFFRKKKKHNRVFHLFQSLTVGTGLILLWRGMWGLLDVYLFPNHPILSYTISFLLGLFILLIDDIELSMFSDRE